MTQPSFATAENLARLHLKTWSMGELVNRCSDLTAREVMQSPWD